MLDVELLTDEAALRSIAPEWSALEASIRPRLPFRLPCWNILWWKHFQEDNWRVAEELRVYALRDQAGRLIAVAPMMLTRRPGRGIRLFRELQFLGADPNITEWRGPICRDVDQPRVLAALQARFQTSPTGMDWIQWAGITDSIETRLTLEQAGRVDWREPLRDYYLDLPANWDDFRAGLSRNIKESVRKCYNSLKRDGHEFTFHAVSDTNLIPAALDRFFVLHAARSNLIGTTRHANVFEQPVARAFLTELGEHLASKNRLRIFQVEIAGTVVATRIGFLMDDELFLYYSGYLPEWSRYSVMTTVVTETLRWAIEQNLKVVNLSTGTDVSKTRWSPRETLHLSGLQGGTAWHQALSFKGYHALKHHSRSDAWVGKLIRRTRRQR